MRSNSERIQNSHIHISLDNLSVLQRHGRPDPFAGSRPPRDSRWIRSVRLGFKTWATRACN